MGTTETGQQAGQTDTEGAAAAAARRLALFEERYGGGAFERLTSLLHRPCVTFAEIAQQFGVTRERVRQWHRAFLPDAPTGLARRRACARLQQRRRLFADPIFRAFFRHLRPFVGSGQLSPIRSRTGYRTRAVLVNGRVVALKDSARTRVLRRPDAAEFIFLRLGDQAFALLPAAAIPVAGVRVSAGLPPSLMPFVNTFEALAVTIANGHTTPAASPLRSGRDDERR